MANKHFEEFAQDCANKLASQIEAGKAPWSLGGSIPEYPVDAISGKPLEGITALQLLVREKTSGFEDNRWLTRTQIAALGGCLKKGARGVPSIVWNLSGEGKLKPTKLPETYFNVEQCDGLSKLAPPDKIEHQPESLLDDLCLSMGLKQTTDYDSYIRTFPAFVSKNRELVFGSNTFYDPSGKNSSKERLNRALDGLRAVSDELSHRQWQQFTSKNDSIGRSADDYADEFALRSRLAQTFMQPYAGNKLPITDKDMEETNNKNIAALIRKQPSVLFEACADISKTVNQAIEKSERSYILLDFERQEVKLLKAGQCRDYVAREINNLKLPGSVTSVKDFQDLQEELCKKGYFDPYRTLQPLLNPNCSESYKKLCDQINHCGFAFVENRPLESKELPFDVQNLLILAHARSPRMGELTEQAVSQSRIAEDVFGSKQKWLKEQQEILSKGQHVPTAEEVMKLWDRIAYNRRVPHELPVNLNQVWLVDFDKNSVGPVPTEKAINQSLALIEKWTQKISRSADNLRSNLFYQYRSFTEERSQRQSVEAPFLKALDADKDISFCDRFLNPARSGENARLGNIVLRDLDHKGLVLCRSKKELLEVTSWQGKELTAQSENLLKKAGLNIEQVKENCKPQTDMQAQQSFNDFCCAQKTFYSVETARRQRSEEQSIRQILQGATPEKIQEIKELIKAEIEKVSQSNRKEIPKNEVSKQVRQQSGMER